MIPQLEEVANGAASNKCLLICNYVNLNVGVDWGVSIGISICIGFWIWTKLETYSRRFDQPPRHHEIIFFEPPNDAAPAG